MRDSFNFLPWQRGLAMGCASLKLQWSTLGAAAVEHRRLLHGGYVAGDPVPI